MTTLEQEVHGQAQRLEHLEELLSITDYDEIPTDLSEGARALLDELDVSVPPESAGEIFDAFIIAHTLEVWSNVRFIVGAGPMLQDVGATLAINGPTIWVEFSYDGAAYGVVKGRHGGETVERVIHTELVIEHFEHMLSAEGWNV